MQPVTDPNILAQLNGGQAAPTPIAPTQDAQPQQSAQGLHPVTDPTTLAQLNGTMDKTKGPNADVPSYLNPGTTIGGALQSLGSAINYMPGNIGGMLGMTDSKNLPSGVVGGLNQLGEGIVQKMAQVQGSAPQQQFTTQNINDIQQGINNLPGAETGATVGRNALLAAAPANAIGVGLMTAANHMAAPDATGQETLGDTALSAAGQGLGAALGTKALSMAGGAAMKYLTGGDMSGANAVAGATPGDTQANAKALQDLVQTQHGIAQTAENDAWAKVRAQSKDATLPNSAVNDLQQIVLDASSGNPALGSQAAKFSRLAQGGQPIPASTILDTRQALSKASVNDAGLRDSVDAFDNILKNKLGVTGIDDAVAATRSRYQNFVDQKAVAKIADPASTPETVAAKIFNASDPQAADKFNQVLTAVKNTGGDIQTARTHMQQGVANSLLGDAVQGADRSGAPLVNSTKLANNIQDLRTNNQSLWNQLPSSTRQSLSQVEQAQRPYGGVVGLGIKAVKGAANLGLKAAPGVVGDAVNGAMAGESLVPMSKILGQIKMPAGGSALAAEAPVSGPVPPVGAITRSPMGSQQGAARSDAIPVLGGGAAGVAGVSYLANQMRNQGNQPGGNNQQPNPQGQAAMASMPPPPVSAAPTAPISTTMPMHDELGDFIKGLPPAQAVTRTIIANEEGTRPTVYTDKTGHKTVAQGFNMDAPNARAIWKRAGVAENFNDVYKGQAALSNDSINKLTNITTDAAQKAAQKIVPNYDQLGDNQKAALNSLVYQLGSNGLAKFRSMLNYLAQGNSKAVENSLINSRLGQSQAPARTRREAMMLAYNMPHDVADATLASQGRISSTERKYLPQ